MPTTNTKNNRLDLAFAALLSDDDAAILTALTRIENEGDSRAIRPLLTALARTTDPKVQNTITGLLYQVKAKNATDELCTALNDPTLLDVRKTVLATFWNAGLDVRDHLAKFIDIAIDGDAGECFECLTVIENQEIWPEQDARSALKKVRTAATSEKDAYKGAILNDIVGALEYRLGVE